MFSAPRLFVPLLLLLGPLITPADAATLVLPLRSFGVSDTTIEVSRSLLEGSLRDLGVAVLGSRDLTVILPAGPDACDEPSCATTLAGECGADQAIFGSLGRLGDKVIVRVGAIRIGEVAPYFSDQLTALTEEDLDTVFRRVAEAVAGGRPNAERATVHSVTEDEARSPRRRATRSGLCFLAGFLYPTRDSFGGADRMTSIRLAHRYETPTLLVESTALTGVAWGDDSADWTVIDVAVTRVLRPGDFSPYLGAAIGIHRVAARFDHVVQTPNGYGGFYEYTDRIEQSETAPSFDLVAGGLALRTYDFEITVELRYHHVFEKLSRVGGKGAQGFLISFGTSR